VTNESAQVPFPAAESLEKLDLLPLTVAKPRKVHPDGIHDQSLRYVDPVLAASIGEAVTIRHGPRDLAEIRVVHEDRFLCRAICSELAGRTIGIKDITAARNTRSNRWPSTSCLCPQASHSSLQQQSRLGVQTGWLLRPDRVREVKLVRDRDRAHHVGKAFSASALRRRTDLIDREVGSDVMSSPVSPAWIGSGLCCGNDTAGQGVTGSNPVGLRSEEPAGSG
jgi:hypothetical protein